MSFKLIIYNEECLNLTKSLLLKSDLLAKSVEYLLTGNYNYLANDRKTWKYYLNLSGEYHTTNEKMYITSLDTLTTIEFTKDVLAEHPVTEANYLPNSPLLNDLLLLYPNNNLLILGIIYKTSIEECIAVPEYTILGYDYTLVGIQEIDLIPELQKRLHTEFHTSINRDYADIESYYAIAIMRYVAKQALTYIKLLRLSKYKTTQACDYYIWTYINSKLYLEDLKDNLTKEVIFYLYKNIDRLTSGLGSNSILDELVGLFLNSNSISTSRLHLLKDTREINNIPSTVPVSYVEQPLTNESIEFTANIDDYVGYGDDSSARGIDNYIGSLESRFLTGTDRVKTRELKIYEVIKNLTDTQLLLTDIDVHIQATMEGWYNKTHNIINHVSGRVYTISTREAIIFYTYVVRKKFGIETGVIPPHTQYILPRATRPTVAYLMNTYNLTVEYATAILAALPPVPTQPLTRIELDDYIISVKVTYPNVIRLVRQNTTRRNQASISGIYNDLYLTGDVDLATPGVTYTDWLTARGMDFITFDQTDYIILEEFLLADVFNIDLKTQTSQYVRAITTLVSRLNNYRVNLRAEVESDSVIDHHLSPIYCDVTPAEDTILNNYINLSTYSSVSSLEVDYLIKYNPKTTIQQDVIEEESGLPISVGIKPLSIKTQVITSMSNYYQSKIESRNSNVE